MHVPLLVPAEILRRIASSPGVLLGQIVDLPDADRHAGIFDREIPHRPDDLVDFGSPGRRRGLDADRVADAMLRRELPDDCPKFMRRRHLEVRVDQQRLAGIAWSQAVCSIGVCSEPSPIAD